MSYLVSIATDAYPADALARLGESMASAGAARAAIWLSQLAYEDEAAKVATVMARWGVTPLLVFDRPSPALFATAHARGFVARSGDIVVVAFGGTDPLVFANWITDLHFVRDASGVHRGFAQALDLMWPEIAALLPRDGTRLLFAGHSLGAALAQLAALRAFETLGLAPDAVYGFGTPRVGDAAYAARANAAFGMRHCRLAHGQDIVPSLPPVALGFNHAGRYLHCDRLGHFDLTDLSPAPSEAPGNGDAPATSLRDLLPNLAHLLRRTPDPDDDRRAGPQNIARSLPAIFGDHLPFRYWNALEGVA